MNPAVVAAGFWLGGDLHGKVNHTSKLVLTSHDRIAIVKARTPGAWLYMARQFCGRGSVWAAPATCCSSFVRTVTAGNAIAVRLAAQQRGSDNAARPIADTKRAPKDDWIIATDNASIGDAGRRPA
jgi:hypothetical protein